MKKIKIALMLDTIDHVMGGTEKQLLLLIKYLDKQKFKPFICVHKNSKWIEENKDKYNIFYFDFPSFFNPKNYLNWLKFISFLKREKIDIVQPIFRDSYILGILAAKVAGIKNIVATRRNLGYWINQQELLILKTLNKMASHFLVNSKSIKKALIEKEDIPSEKITVIYNGFEFNSDNHSLSNKLPELKESDYLIITVANLRPVKGLDILINSAKIVHEQESNAKFWIIGEGAERKKLEKQIDELQLKNIVHLIGHSDNIRKFLKLASIGVLTSHMEGLSNSIIEYMAAGLPVVATDVGGAFELVENNVNGYLVDNSAQKIAQSILKIISNKQLAESMSIKSKEKANTLFSKEKMITATEQYYLKIVDKNYNAG